jgi:hypothetical protein
MGDAAAASPSRSLPATMRLAASVGWNASQNTYLERSLHSDELELAMPMQRNGGKLPPQHGSSALSKPGGVEEPKDFVYHKRFIVCPVTAGGMPFGVLKSETLHFAGEQRGRKAYHTDGSSE